MEALLIIIMAIIVFVTILYAIRKEDELHPQKLKQSADWAKSEVDALKKQFDTHGTYVIKENASKNSPNCQQPAHQPLEEAAKTDDGTPPKKRLPIQCHVILELNSTLEEGNDSRNSLAGNLAIYGLSNIQQLNPTEKKLSAQIGIRDYAVNFGANVGVNEVEGKLTQKGGKIYLFKDTFQTKIPQGLGNIVKSISLDPDAYYTMDDFRYIDEAGTSQARGF